jgi:hypothetical protein
MSVLTQSEDDYEALPLESIDEPTSPPDVEDDTEPPPDDEDDADLPEDDVDAADPLPDDDEDDAAPPEDDEDDAAPPDEEEEEEEDTTAAFEDVPQAAADIVQLQTLDIEVASTATATTAAELQALLNDNVTETINIDTWISDPVGAVALQMDKTINITTPPGPTSLSGASINGNISGGFTITVTGNQQGGHLGISGIFDCSFIVVNASISIHTSAAALGSNRSITVGDSSGNWGHVSVHGTFVNNGTITLNGGLHVETGATFVNSGVITLNAFFHDNYDQMGQINIYGAFNNSNGTVNNNGRISVHSTGSFQRPTTLSNAEGFLWGRAASNFSGAFSFLTFDANGGRLWDDSPLVVMVEPAGVVFNLSKFNYHMGFSPPAGYAFNGWFTQRTGGTRVDMENTAFQGAGQTLFAQWVEATTASEIINFLQAPGDGTFTMKTHPGVWYNVDVRQNITLGGNKTIIAGTHTENSGTARVEIYGNLTGGFTLTIQRGELSVLGEIDCNIRLTEWGHFQSWGYDGSFNALLRAGRTIDATNGHVHISSNFDNRGTITTQNHISISDSATFTNSGTIVLDRGEVSDEWGPWTIYGSLSIHNRARFVDNGGTVINRGTIYAGSNGIFAMPTNFTTNEGLIYGASAANFSGAFDFLTLNANGGHFNQWWPPTTTAVVAVTRGSMFNLTLIQRHIWANRDSNNEEHFYIRGWALDAAGVNELDMSNTAFNGIGRTLFAVWGSWTVPGESDEWIVSDEELQTIIEEAVAGNGVVMIDFSDVENLAMLTLPIAQLAAINDEGAGLAVTIALPNGTITLNAAALASLIEQAGGEDILLTLFQPSAGSAALNSNQWDSIRPTDEIFSITLETASGGAITQFDGHLTITLPWTGAFPARAYHLPSSGIPERMPVAPTATANTVAFTTNHLSIYIVRYSPETTTPGGAPQTGDYRSIIIPVIMIALGTLGFAGWIVYSKRVKKTSVR